MSDIAQNTEKAFALYWSKHPNEAAILALVKQGVDVQAIGNNNWTLLHWAAWSGQRDVCVELIKQHADINARAELSKTPLHCAEYADAETVGLLSAYGADIHARNSSGRTVLHLIARSIKPEATTLLLAQGANIWAEDNYFRTALVRDKTKLLVPHCERWEKVLRQVMDGKIDHIKSTEDLYHLASVMKPENPQNIPEPKEFIRELFARYLPHNEHLNKLYSTIFNKSRGHETLAGVRDSARREVRGGVV